MNWPTAPITSLSIHSKTRKQFTYKEDTHTVKMPREGMSQWIKPFGFLRAEIFQDNDGQQPLWEADEVVLLLLLIVDVLTLPFALLLIVGIGRDQSDISN